MDNTQAQQFSEFLKKLTTENKVKPREKVATPIYNKKVEVKPVVEEKTKMPVEPKVAPKIVEKPKVDVKKEQPEKPKADSKPKDQRVERHWEWENGDPIQDPFFHTIVSAMGKDAHSLPATDIQALSEIGKVIIEKVGDNHDTIFKYVHHLLRRIPPVSDGNVILALRRKLLVERI